MEVAATTNAYKVPLGLEDLKSAIISQSTDITAVIVTCQCCDSHVYLKSFSTTPLIGSLQETQWWQPLTQFICSTGYCNINSPKSANSRSNGFLTAYNNFMVYKSLEGGEGWVSVQFQRCREHDCTPRQIDVENGSDLPEARQRKPMRHVRCSCSKKIWQDERI